MGRDTLSGIDYAALAQGLKPFVVPWISSPATGTDSAGGGMSAHALNGPYHSGLIGDAQATQFLKTNGSRSLTGNLSVSGGVTIDGVDISGHAADVNAHHAQVHSITGTNHTIGGSDLDVVGNTVGGGLGLITPSSDPGAAAAILRSDSGGGLTVEQLAATNYVRTPEVRATADLTLDPAGGDVFLPADRRLGTSTFTSGFTGSGARYETTTGATALEVDNVIVRGRMRVYELLIAQIRATNGSVLIANAAKVNAVSGTGPYTLTVEPAMTFANGDIIRAQRFTGSGTYVSMGTVSGVSGLNLTFTLTATYDAPTVGMEFVRIGSTSDASRRGSIYLTADETHAPYIDVLGGIDAASDWGTAGVINMRIGRLDGITSGTNEYGLWARGTGANDHLLISPASGFDLVAGGGVFKINEATGFEIVATTAASWDRAYSFSNASGDYAGLRGYYETAPAKNYGILYGATVGNKAPQLMVWAEGTDTYPGVIQLLAWKSGGAGADIVLTATDTSIAMTGNTTITGTLNVSGDVTIGSNDTSPTLSIGDATVTTGDAAITVGEGRTGSGNAYIDLVGDATYTDYGLRILRDNGGENAQTAISHRGTGNFVIEAKEAATMYLQTSDTTRIQIASDGLIGMGVAPATARLKVVGSVALGGDDGGQASYVTYTNVTAGVSTGPGSVKMNSLNPGNSTGWLKVYVGTDARYIPYWSNIAP